MNKKGILAVAIIIIVFVLIASLIQGKKERNQLEQATIEKNLPRVYVNSSLKFTIRIPEGYIVDEAYKYQQLGPGKDIPGIRFIVPASLAAGTNLSSDSYVSVEQAKDASDCTAAAFTYPNTPVQKMTIDGTKYSVATTSDAGAGNRYEETVFALPDTNPCFAIRYLLHYSAIENYPAGKVRAFDRKAVIDQFDQIRNVLEINK